MLKIVALPGDGIGPEVIKQAVKVLKAVSIKYKCPIEIKEAMIGGAAIDKTGKPLPQETIDICKLSNGMLLGAVGGPKWDALPGNLRPEAGLLGIRKELRVFANLRPAILFPQLKSASNLKEEVLGDNLNIMIVRELIGGAYFGEKKRVDIANGQKAWDVIEYSTYEIERITKMAFEIARGRNKKLTLVDKANVLESSKLWREVVQSISGNYRDVELNCMYVDNAAMQLIRDPHQFDVIVTENMFGDILSDEASMLTGSLGMLPSASLGITSVGLYEPIHGSAPDIAGLDKANPIGAIMSVAMMFRYSFKMEEIAKAIENSVYETLDIGYRTIDIMQLGMNCIGTEKMGDYIASKI
ncbi:3-isopropylmalate dehydrogenase [Clostridium sp.]|uniref:3-isopropylmalate dehydrogenase n=1 Tax=Clostridium sp. TaxID=1506 RepID=UPI001A5B3D8B|nr:3-isopropylmalate dehydrogenase [Clostridium sp.]MBK5241753.1 3-isopropylmalate dehydrogenase [Clostridium sp.]